MAVTFDSAFAVRDQNITSNGALAFRPSTCNTQTGTVTANSNRLLIGIVGFNAPQATMGTVAMIWDYTATNQSMTPIIGVDVGTFGSIYLFGLKNPVAGDPVFTATWTGGNTVDVSMAGISLYNCDQTTSWNNSGTDTGTGTNPSSTVTTSSGDMAVVAHIDQNASSIVINLGSSGYIETNINGNYAGGYLASISASSTISWTLGSSVAWAHAKVNVLQVGGTAPTLWAQSLL